MLDLLRIGLSTFVTLLVVVLFDIFTVLLELNHLLLLGDDLAESFNLNLLVRAYTHSQFV